MINLELWRDPRNNPRSMFKTWDQVGKEIDSFFDLFENMQRENSSASMRALTAACDVHEDEKAYVVTLDMPGIKKEDIQIDLSAQTLTVVGHRQRESHLDTKDARFHRSERHYGEFRRTFSLPDNIDGDRIEASFENGVLSIALPKTEIERPKRITIGENKGGFFKKLVTPKVEEVKKQA